MDSLYLFPPDDNPQMKACTGPCGRTLPATTEYFHVSKDGPHGLHSHCKKCRVKKKEFPKKGGRPLETIERPCTKCGETDSDKFHYKPRRDGSKKRFRICKKCESKESMRYAKANKEKISNMTKEWHKRNPGYNRKARLKRDYNMSLDDYQAMVDAQSGICKICGRIPPDGDYLHIDHCHASGKVRGLLCGKCNNGLGFFNDNPAFFRSAALYLEEASQNHE